MYVLNWTSRYIEKQRIKVSVVKTAMAAYSPKKRVPLARRALWLNGERIKRALVVKYFGLHIDGRVSWRPALKHTLFQCLRLICILCRTCGRSCVNGQTSMVKLCSGLILSRPLNALPHIQIGRPRWDSLEIFHRVALRFCFGVPPVCDN